ncbi:helix-turn-helix transcriptional regulator (plasmid) [Arthrobacter sp. TES]|uniref:ArsR/SmtB family transcription factor n=1 Tax=Paenarthrobacter ureafaciens TaxID=37931 RepID=UPI000397C531|nr:metalloregulator ArsR/SmtB family transcription factor [Paenarthrobacter ureafaciens]AOY73874.1 ArsR family transcriptional regulator [Arthrobacter sp. ZXY-2]ERI38078.1 ArsR family transcriptional regulator [Arthrobacter sp. AK-YN10]QOI65731.1 helix-turn-helix transcriptional regulator [Arthrobacter sp. TES]GLU60883.1 transcriptional regulator [Paenarthrobacter ureafaciens]GLU65153.1 transcriptional regulator [Paenarthrobacter ureafaciens]
MTGTAQAQPTAHGRPGSECAIRLVDAEKVEAVRSRMPAESDVTDLAVIFGLLSDPGRVRILIALLEGEMCVCDLAATTGLSESGVSHALRLLRGPRVVQVRRSGRMAYYSLADSHVRMLLDLGLTHVGHAGQDRLTMVSNN